jgi:hypothetical protein
MIHFAVAFALLLHVFFWGLGLARLTMPRRWRRFWPVLVFPAGFALQSLVVWTGAYAGLPGTHSYAWPAELIPLALLAWAVWRSGFGGFRKDVVRFGLVWTATGGALILLVLPLAIASRGLTTVSLGSCDAADYAAGARVLMEFAHSDRTGFLGLTEVVGVMSADNFFDFWLRLNHFTPSALMALNGSVLSCAPHELASLLTMVIVAASVPVVFWSSRALFGYSGAASLVIAAVYGISPIAWYSVAQVSPAPLLAANAIALLTWAAIAAWNGLLTWRRGAQFAGVLAIAYALLLGSYNFILLVSLVPAVAYAGSRALASGDLARLARWVLVVIAPLAASSVLFWDRVAGLLERFMLFRTYDFGWRIPVLTPEGWLGMVAGGGLGAWNWAGLRWVLAALVVAALTWAVVVGLRMYNRRLWIVASIVVPVLAGYSFLEARGLLLNTNASYDAFKLFAVFYALLLPAFCWWITLRWSSHLLGWFAVASVAVVVVGFNLVACGMFIFKLSRPPLIVDGELRQIRKVETMPDVGSVNVLLPDMWSRLWANVFLLRKPQYFATHTYEGRLNTPLRGEWDLTSALVRGGAPGPGSRQIASHLWLLDTRQPAYVRVALGDGWYDPEQLAGVDRWCWTRGSATLRVDNPRTVPVLARVRLDARSLGGREVTIAVAGATSVPPVMVGEARGGAVFPEVTLPPGRSTLVLEVGKGAARAAGDSRLLGICVYSVVVETRPAKVVAAKRGE